jgi:hypothetical protein
MPRGSARDRSRKQVCERLDHDLRLADLRLSFVADRIGVSDCRAKIEPSPSLDGGDRKLPMRHINGGYSLRLSEISARLRQQATLIDHEANRLRSVALFYTITLKKEDGICTSPDQKSILSSKTGP